MAPLQLLPRESLLKTGPVDHADWCYRPLLGSLMRVRFRLIRRLLPQSRVGTLLEIGYGSGIFLPMLSQHCERLVGLDVHEHHEEVRNKLAQIGVEAHLLSASAEAIPLDDQSVDTVVAVSSLEFIPNIDQATRELRRVLRPGGSLTLVTPEHSPIADFGLKLLTGKRAKTDYEDRRERLLPALLQSFRIEREIAFPPLVPRALGRLYRGLRLAPIHAR